MSATRAARGGIVAKKKVGRPTQSGGEGRHVRIDPELYNKARVVALRRGLKFGEYLDSLIETPVNRDYQRVLKELVSDSEGGGK